MRIFESSSQFSAKFNDNSSSDCRQNESESLIVAHQIFRAHDISTTSEDTLKTTIRSKNVIKVGYQACQSYQHDVTRMSESFS